MKPAETFIPYLLGVPEHSQLLSPISSIPQAPSPSSEAESPTAGLGAIWVSGQRAPGMPELEPGIPQNHSWPNKGALDPPRERKAGSMELCHGVQMNLASSAMLQLTQRGSKVLRSGRCLAGFAVRRKFRWCVAPLPLHIQLKIKRVSALASASLSSPGLALPRAA